MDLITAIVTLSAAAIGFLGAILKEHLSKKSELKNKRFEWQKEYGTRHLVEPIISYVDEVLEVMADAYWYWIDTGSDDSDESENKFKEIWNAKLKDKVISYRAKDKKIEARLAAIGNPKLKKMFDNFMSEYGRFATKERILWWDTMKKASEIAGKIFVELTPKLRTLKKQ